MIHTKARILSAGGHLKRLSSFRVDFDNQAESYLKLKLVFQNLMVQVIASLAILKPSNISTPGLRLTLCGISRIYWFNIVESQEIQ